MTLPTLKAARTQFALRDTIRLIKGCHTTLHQTVHAL